MCGSAVSSSLSSASFSASFPTFSAALMTAFFYSSASSIGFVQKYRRLEADNIFFPLSDGPRPCKFFNASFSSLLFYCFCYVPPVAALKRRYRAAFVATTISIGCVRKSSVHSLIYLVARDNTLRAAISFYQLFLSRVTRCRFDEVNPRFMVKTTTLTMGGTEMMLLDADLYNAADR